MISACIQNWGNSCYGAREGTHLRENLKQLCLSDLRVQVSDVQGGLSGSSRLGRRCRCGLRGSSWHCGRSSHVCFSRYFRGRC